MAGSPLSAVREKRFLWYKQVKQHDKTVEEVCEIFGISRKTYYKWYRHDHGLTKGVRKSRKTHPQLKIVGGVRRVIVEAKEKYNYGPVKMAIYVKRELGVKVSASAIYKFYKQRHLIRKPQKRQTWYQPLKQPFVASTPGENVQLDVKYVPGPERSWNYQFRFIDVVTNLQYATDMPLKDARTTIRAFEAAKRSLPFEILGVQTDNGGEFRGVFHQYLDAVGVEHRYIPKRSAPWNGKVERANRSVDDEFYRNPYKPHKTIRQYTHWYNNKRPHLGKGMDGLTPYEKFLSLTS